MLNAFKRVILCKTESLFQKLIVLYVQIFRNRTQPEHNGDSLLEKLPIDTVSQIELDYMHLVCLGITKQMLRLWVRGRKDVRLLTDDVDFVSRHLLAIRHCISSEFSRKPRSLNDIDR